MKSLIERMDAVLDENRARWVMLPLEQGGYSTGPIGNTNLDYNELNGVVAYYKDDTIAIALGGGSLAPRFSIVWSWGNSASRGTGAETIQEIQAALKKIQSQYQLRASQPLPEPPREVWAELERSIPAE